MLGAPNESFEVVSCAEISLIHSATVQCIHPWKSPAMACATCPRRKRSKPKPKPK